MDWTLIAALVLLIFGVVGAAKELLRSARLRRRHWSSRAPIPLSYPLQPPLVIQRHDAVVLDDGNGKGGTHLGGGIEIAERSDAEAGARADGRGANDAAPSRAVQTGASHRAFGFGAPGRRPLATPRAAVAEADVHEIGLAAAADELDDSEELAAQTLRLLPGRLEVEDGPDTGAEFRFVDLPGARQEVTFGRRAGQPLRHVQLRSSTVSRDHAIMTREGSAWFIANLSRTNPVIINGVVLGVGEEPRLLEAADRIEMGDVVLRYYDA